MDNQSDTRLIAVTDKKQTEGCKMLLRICPNSDGTFKASIWNLEEDRYVEIAPADAVNLLASEDTLVKVAVNDPTHSHSHYECNAGRMYKI